MKIGPTGKRPFGKISDDDQGEIAIAIGSDPAHGIVRLEFGAAVKWIGLPSALARALAAQLIASADALDKGKH